MADWFFAPFARFQAAPWTPDGMTPATPWYRGTNHTGPSAVDFALMAEGDTLWVLDNHNSGTTDGLVQGPPPAGLTIRGDYPGRPGTLQVLTLRDTTDITVMNLKVTGGSLGFTDVDGLLIDGLLVSNMDKGFATTQDSNVDNITIRRCTFHHLVSEGIECFARLGYTRDNWLIEDCTIFDVGYDTEVANRDFEGIGLQRLTNSTIQRNHIHHCKYGINIWESGDGQVQDVVIRHNQIHDITGGPSNWPSRGIMLSGGSDVAESFTHLTIMDNLVYNIGKEGIRIPIPVGAQGNICADNRIANVNTEFGTPNTQYLTDTTGWELTNNRTYSRWPRGSVGAARRRR